MSLSDEIKNDLAKYEANNKKLLKLVGNEVVNLFSQTFERQRSPSGAAWKKRKNNIDPERGVLIGKRHRTDNVNPYRLKDSIHIAKITKNKDQIASNNTYAKIHNEGLGNMPKRAFMENSKATRKAISKGIDYFMRTFMKF